MSAGGYISAPAFVRATLIGSALLTIVSAAVTWRWSEPVAKGIAIGGFAGALGFWMIVRNASTLLSIPKQEIPFRVYRWTFARVFLYALALLFAYQVDTAGRSALLGAAGGLFITRVVMLFTGIVSWRGQAKADDNT